MLTALALLSLVSIAATSLDEDPAFRAGLSSYEALELEKAAFRFKAAGATATLQPADRARAYAWLGVTLVQLGVLDEAAAAFRVAVAQDPGVVLPTKAPPQAESLLAEAKASAGGAQQLALAPIVDAPPAPAPAPALAAEPPSPPWLLIGGGALVGAGVGAAAAATVVGVRALIVADQAEAEPFHGAAASLYREAESDALVANVLWVGAAAGVVVGAGIVAAAVVLE